MKTVEWDEQRQPNHPASIRHRQLEFQARLHPDQRQFKGAVVWSISHKKKSPNQKEDV